MQAIWLEHSGPNCQLSTIHSPCVSAELHGIASNIELEARTKSNFRNTSKNYDPMFTRPGSEWRYPPHAARARLEVRGRGTGV